MSHYFLPQTATLGPKASGMLGIVRKEQKTTQSPRTNPSQISCWLQPCSLQQLEQSWIAAKAITATDKPPECGHWAVLRLCSWKEGEQRRMQHWYNFREHYSAVSEQKKKDFLCLLEQTDSVPPPTVFLA